MHRRWLALGAAALVLAAGLDTTPSLQADVADQAGAAFGWAVAAAGDVNGDGYADVLVGAPTWDSDTYADEGRAYLLLGSAGGLLSTPSWSLHPTDQAGALFGEAVAGVGDLNRDGYDDVAIGAPGWDSGIAPDEGRVYVYFGSASGLGTTPIELDPTDQIAAGFGRALAGAGDVNGDGYADLLVGAPGWSDGFTLSEGRAYLYYGVASGLSTASAWSAHPTDQIAAGFGRALAGAGDLNGDGYDDFAIAAPAWDDTATVDEGRLYVYFGSAAGPAGAPLALNPTAQFGAAFGSAVAAAADINNDGRADLAVGAPYWDSTTYTDEGRVYVYFGSASGLGTTAVTLDPADQVAAFFGGALGGAGDVDGDGYADLLVGTPGWDSTTYADEGRADVFHGSASGLGSTPAWTVHPTDQLDAHFGQAVAPAGDVDGDRGADVVVGAPDWDSATYAGEGRIYVYRGTPPADATAPAAITTLAVSSTAATAVTLTWTAPGDDGTTGTATSYDVRYSTTGAITESTWPSATPATGEPTPSAAGSSETFQVTGLTGGTTYWFAVKATDDAGNTGAISNSPTTTTTTSTSTSSDTIAPAAITDLRIREADNHKLKLEWTAPGDDGTTGTAAKYELRISTQGPILADSDWTNAQAVSIAPSPAAAGTRQRFTIEDRKHAIRYWVAIKTSDEVPNTSGLSNSPGGKTLDPQCSASTAGAPGGAAAALALLAALLGAGRSPSARSRSPPWP